MPPLRPATEACSGSLELGRPSRAQSANTRHPAGKRHTPPTDRMYATDVRQTAHCLMPPGLGQNKMVIGKAVRPTLIVKKHYTVSFAETFQNWA